MNQVIEQSLLILAVEKESVQRRRDDFLRDQQDFALNHKASKNYPQEHDEKEMKRQIQEDQYAAMVARQETDKGIIRYEQEHKLAGGEKARLKKQYKEVWDQNRLEQQKPLAE